MKRFLLFYRLKRIYKKHVKFDSSVLIGKNSIFEGMNYIDSNSSFNGEMGFGSYIAKNTHLEAKIGRFCSIGSFVRLNNGVHPYSIFVSTSPVFYSLSKKIKGGTFVDKQYFEELSYADNEKKFPIIIGNDCWIGDGVFFVGGVTIGDGAVILAHSVVSKDIPPYSIVGGVPAKVLKYRFDEMTIHFLLDFKWWNKDELWLRNNLSLMQDVELLKDNSIFL